LIASPRREKNFSPVCLREASVAVFESAKLCEARQYGCPRQRQQISCVGTKFRAAVSILGASARPRGASVRVRGASAQNFEQPRAYMPRRYAQGVAERVRAFAIRIFMSQPAFALRPHRIWRSGMRSGCRRWHSDEAVRRLTTAAHNSWPRHALVAWPFVFWCRGTRMGRSILAQLSLP